MVILQRILINLTVFTQLTMAQAMFFGQNVSSAAGPPTHVATISGSVNQGASFTYTISTSISAGEVGILSLTCRDTASSFCATITGITAASGSDTLTLSGAGDHYQGYACISVYTIFNPTPSGSYTIIIQGGASSPAAFQYVFSRFAKNGLTGTADGTCSNNSAGATTLACSGAITPTGTVELAIGVSAQYDNLQGSETDDSTPAFTIPTNGKVGVGAIGALVFTYYVGNPPAATLTPKTKNLGLGDPLAIWGAAWK